MSVERIRQEYRASNNAVYVSMLRDMTACLVEKSLCEIFETAVNDENGYSVILRSKHDPSLAWNVSLIWDGSSSTTYLKHNTGLIIDGNYTTFTTEASRSVTANNTLRYWEVTIVNGGDSFLSLYAYNGATKHYAFAMFNLICAGGNKSVCAHMGDQTSKDSAYFPSNTKVAFPSGLYSFNTNQWAAVTDKPVPQGELLLFPQLLSVSGESNLQTRFGVPTINGKTIYCIENRSGLNLNYGDEFYVGNKKYVALGDSVAAIESD